MELKELGNTGVMVPEIGLGTWKYTGGVEPLRWAIALGAFLIDTAELYRTEDVVGQAVKGNRDRVFIATKVMGSHLRYDQVMQAAESSLRQLGTDYIDLYQIHWPNPSVPIKETMRAMEALADSGQVRYIGVSNFSVKELEEARSAMTKYPLVSNQVLYNLKRREIEKDLLPYCQQNHITVIAYTPLADGSLTARPSSQQGQRRGPLHRAAGRLLGRESEGQGLEEVANEVGKTPAQVALNWCISHPGVITIPKSNNLARIEENCGASGRRLSENQLRQLDEAFPA
jgi:diketogulonate reductase-like aldo/keto reductase